MLRLATFHCLPTKVDSSGVTGIGIALGSQVAAATFVQHCNFSVSNVGFRAAGTHGLPEGPRHSDEEIHDETLLPVFLGTRAALRECRSSAIPCHGHDR